MFNSYRQYIEDLIEMKQSAYIRFFNENYEFLVKYAYSIINNFHDAKDIVSELIQDLPKDLEVVLHSDNMFTSDAKFNKWLVVNCKNRCSKYFSNLKRKLERELLLDDNCCYHDDNNLKKYDLQYDIFVLFPETMMREIFVLRYILELRINDIAKTLDMSPSMVKRKLKIISDILDEYYKE